MTAPAKNHFISVSRDGRLVARRVGGALVVVAHVSEPWRVEAGHLGAIGIHFEPSKGAHAREIRVVAIDYDGVRRDVDAFLAHVGACERELAGWMREAVERALDAG